MELVRKDEMEAETEAKMEGKMEDKMEDEMEDEGRKAPSMYPHCQTDVRAFQGDLYSLQYLAYHPVLTLS